MEVGMKLALELSLKLENGTNFEVGGWNEVGSLGNVGSWNIFGRKLEVGSWNRVGSWN